MPKFRKLKIDITNSLHRWMYYMDYGYKEPDSPFTKEVLQMDQGLYQFAQQYQRNVSDPKTLYDYYGYMMECMDELERIDTAKAIGIEMGTAIGMEKGTVLGIEKGNMQTAIKALRFMHKIGVSNNELKAFAWEHRISDSEVQKILQ